MAGDQVVFLFDVDNTLLDNDHIVADLMKHLKNAVGEELQKDYWKIFEELRSELGYADYLGALQRYRIENPRDTPHLLAVSLYLIDYPFANRLFPNSLDVIEHCSQWGTTVVLSDGDAVFQPHKVNDSGLFEAVEGRVLIYIHKELELADVEKKFPADHYVLIDDKLRILDAIKQAWGKKVTTVFPKQGHYALDKEANAKFPPADLAIERIGDLMNYDLAKILAATKG